MKKLLPVMIIACTLLLMIGCASKPAQPTLDESFAATDVPEVEETPEPVESTPEPTEVPETDEMVPAFESVTGTVLSVAENDILVQLDNGDTFNFIMSNMDETIAGKGDVVTVFYTGDVTDCPEAFDIEVIKVDPVQTITGTVFQHDKKSMFLQISSSDVLLFQLDGNTVITGIADEIMAGDTVDVSYEGDLMDAPHAAQVEILETGSSNRRDDTSDKSNTENKHLNGVVTAIRGSKITIQTSKKNTYSFKMTDKTEFIYNRHELETGCRIRVTYDGYASKNPDAKKIEIISGYEPSPTSSPKHHDTYTVSGIVESFGGMWLSLTNGYGFDVSYASYGGIGKRVPGEHATVTYYHADGIRYATKVVFDPVVY